MLIGSKAAKFWYPDFREPKDEDHFSPDPDLPGDNFWHESFPSHWADNVTANPVMLYTIKVSHSPWALQNGSWEKHMNDILFYQDKGVDFSREAWEILHPVWKEVHGQKRVNLNKTKEDFFGDAVIRKYDHDSLHDSVAYGDEAMYIRILKEGSDVLVDNDKFWAMSHEDKLKTIREEVYATALERWVIPMDYRISPRMAYARAMKKSITSLFKNEWALFIILNYKDLYKPDFDYVAQHKSKSHKLILL
jgi:hypothetical protein